MRSNPALPGGSLTSKPAWSNALEAFFRAGFFWCDDGSTTGTGDAPMEKPSSSMAQQIAEAAGASEQLRTGHGPRSVTVVMSEETPVITLHGALSAAERALHRRRRRRRRSSTFIDSYLHTRPTRYAERSKKITGVGVSEANAEVETKTGTVVHDFTTGTMVQVFLLAHDIPADTWSGSGTVDQS
jgi:uncharacterized protein YbcI